MALVLRSSELSKLFQRMSVWITPVFEDILELIPVDARA
jgi:hypothetical protein